MSLSILRHGLFRASSIFGFWRWRARSKTRVTSSWRTEWEPMTESRFAAHQRLSILTARLWPLPQPIVKSLSKLKYQRRLSLRFVIAWPYSIIAGRTFTGRDGPLGRPFGAPGGRALPRSKRAVKGDHSIWGAAIFVEADVGAIEIELAVRLITGFSC